VLTVCQTTALQGEEIMARAGDELVNPVTGQHLVLVRTAAETGGELLEMESRFGPGGWPPAAHYHPTQHERFEVLEGTLRVILDGEQRDLGAGEVLFAESGVVHQMWNPGEEWARVNWQIRPALNTQTFFETVFGLAGDGKVNAMGVPNLLQAAVLLREYDSEFRLAKPPRIVQGLVFGLLVPVARLLGYRGRYDRYSGAKGRNTDTHT